MEIITMKYNGIESMNQLKDFLDLEPDSFNVEVTGVVARILRYTIPNYHLCEERTIERVKILETINSCEDLGRKADLIRDEKRRRRQDRLPAPLSPWSDLKMLVIFNFTAIQCVAFENKYRMSLDSDTGETVTVRFSHHPELPDNVARRSRAPLKL